MEVNGRKKKGVKSSGGTKSKSVKVSSRQDAKVPDSKQQVEESCGEMEFENLFYNPLTQKSAWDMFQQQQSLPQRNGKRVIDKEPEPIQERQTRSKSVRKEVQKQGTGTTLKKYRKGTKEHSSGGSEIAASQIEAAPSLESSNDIDQGQAMVQELLTRYKTGKNKSKNKTTQRTKPEDVDNEFIFSDLEELSEDEFELQTSDFIKHSVPQYDLKKQLYEMHCSAIQQLTSMQVRKLCVQLIPELKEVRYEILPSTRHELFKSYVEGGISKKDLRDMIVAKPFTDAHDHCVVNVINGMVLEDDDDPTDNNAELLHYINLVLVPEALIRIFAQINRIEFNFAEKELRFGAGYDGELPEDLINSLPEKENQPNDQNE